MSKDKSSQISDKPVKNVINIGQFTFNTRIAWLIGSSFFIGSEAFICSAAQPRITTHNASQAVEQSRKAVQLKPNNEIAWTDLGEALQMRGDLSSAQQTQENALQNNPKLTEARLGLALVKDDQGKTAEVIPELRTTAEEGKSASAYFSLGDSLYEKKDFIGSEAAYRQSIALDPNNDKAHNGLGATLRNQGKLEDAIASYKTAIRINPNYANAYYNLGLALKKQGKKSDAIAQFQKARPLYQQKGDTKTVADIDRLIQELS